jgi:deoxyuridine 5'-triphosphate nucleotidohydrolase
MEIKIKLLPGGKMPTKAHRTDAAWDCYAREDVTVGAEPVLIGLGFMIEPPEGYYVEIVPRSSIGLKTQLRQPNSIGIIDNGYRNEVKAMYESRLMPSSGMLDCTTIPQKIKAGDRIAQMILRKQEEAELVEVDELSETDRGAGGFGSTGVR